MTTRVKVDRLRDFCAGLFEGAGVLPVDALTVADSLVEADLRGVSSHGTTRVGIYLERLQAGLINPRPKVSVVRETPTTILLDGDNGLGAVVGVRAMDEAIRRATAYGTAWVSVRNSNHFGAAAYYVQRAIAARCIGLALTAVSRNQPLCHGGAGRPGAAHRGGQCGDQRGGARQDHPGGEKGRGRPARPGRGRGPADDRRAGRAGWRGPALAQHKGYGIALLIEMLSGVLAGATIAPTVGNLYDNPTGVQNLGHGFGAVRVDALAPIDEFADRMDALIREVRQSPRGAGVPRIYLPGEIEFELAERNRRDGLALAEPTVRELSVLGARLGVGCPF